uniref:UBA domain-containing protein n=1 Tax=Globisporangium ultimum (strain ATCC 200006 / CBS 805.95 / DAOM BR144) TaxID=431595 RepID=K3X671_GLOUD
MDRVVQLSVSDDGNSSFINVSQAERQVWLLRQRVYQVLVDLGDEGEHELQQILSATVSVTSSRQNARIAVQQLLEEDTECLVLSPESLCHAAEEPSSDMGSKLGTKRNSRHDLDNDDEDYESESLADEQAMRDDCSSDAKDDDDDGDESDEDGEDEETEEDEDEEAEGNRAEFVEELMLMGFPEEWCVLALKQTENDISTTWNT